MAVEIIKGFTGKPRACQKLTGFFLGQEEISGCLFVGYPFFDPLGLSQASVIDGLLISPEKGLVAFNLVEEDSVPRDYCEKRDEVCQVIEWNLKRSGKLLRKRKLEVDVNVVTFAPNAKDGLPVEEEGCPICDEKTLGAALANITFCKPELYGEISLAIRTIGKSVKMIERKPLKPGSKGAHCAELEARSSLILDHNQIRAVMETEEGVQRIRGLSGSGKSTVLALKVAYIHACHPEWKIGVTYSTFSLREWYINAITHTGQAPNWDNITVCMAWGNENGKDRTAGMYQIFTDINSVRFYGFSQAKANLGSTDPFAEACERGLYDVEYEGKEIFDIVIVDEAQDFSSSFLRVCFSMLRRPKRIAYAYDEMQNVRSQPLPPPEEIFGYGDNGMPVAGIFEDSADITLGGCYERPHAILSGRMRWLLGYTGSNQRARLAWFRCLRILRCGAPWDMKSLTDAWTSESASLWEELCLAGWKSRLA